MTDAGSSSGGGRVRPLAGVKVVELGLWLAGPACATILADWGADVVKVEPPTGDPFRGIAYTFGGDINPPFDLDNRGKRSLAVDLRTEAGREVVHDLLAGADVMVTNYRPGGLDRLGLGWVAVHERHPRLVYVSITGYGLDGSERDRAAYDMGAFWSRAGVAASLMPGDALPPYQRGGMGDHMTATAAAGGAVAALYRRDRTGEGALVETSLLRNGMYFMGSDLNAALATGQEVVARSVRDAPNPLLTGYQCGDGRWFWMLCVEGDRHWPRVLAALGRPELAHDHRFATMESRAEHATEVIAELQALFLTRPLAEWSVDFDREEVWWAPIQHAHELPSDPQARAARGFVDVPLADGSVATMVATPVDFDGEPCVVSATAPELGEHTELVLLELGRSWDDIAALKEAGVIP